MTFSKTDRLYKALALDGRAMTVAEIVTELDTTIRNVYDMIYRLRDEGVGLVSDKYGYYDEDAYWSTF